MQPNKIKFSRNVAYLEFLFSTFRIQKLSLTIFRKSDENNVSVYTLCVLEGEARKGWGSDMTPEESIKNHKSY